MNTTIFARSTLLCALLATGILHRDSGRLHAQTVAEVSPSVLTGSAPDPVQGQKDERQGFFHRWMRAYAEDWKGTAPEVPEAPRRGFPAPLSSPPFPFSDWPYGGSPVIGAPDTAGGPLVTAIYGGKDGQWWESSRVKIYGWVNS